MHSLRSHVCEPSLLFICFCGSKLCKACKIARKIPLSHCSGIFHSKFSSSASGVVRDLCFAASSIPQAEKNQLNAGSFFKKPFRVCVFQRKILQMVNFAVLNHKAYRTKIFKRRSRILIQNYHVRKLTFFETAQGVFLPKNLGCVYCNRLQTLGQTHPILVHKEKLID